MFATHSHSHITPSFNLAGALDLTLGLHNILSQKNLLISLVDLRSLYHLIQIRNVQMFRPLKVVYPMRSAIISWCRRRR